MSLLDTASLIVTPNGYKEGKLYSVIPSDGSGDLSVTRATTATRVNSAGLVELVPYNLLSYSEDFSNSIWNKTALSISTNSTTAPNGSTTADTITNSSSSGIILQDYSSVNTSQIVTHSVYLKRTNNDWVVVAIARSGATTYGEVYVWFNLATGAVGSNLPDGAAVLLDADIEDAGNGWYRCSVTGYVPNAVAYTAFMFYPDGNGSFNRVTGQSVYAWGSQLVEGSTAKDYQKTETRLNIPRLDYSNGTCPSLLVEPQRTNRLIYSEELVVGKAFAYASGTFSVTQNTTDTLDPFGNNNADKFTAVDQAANDSYTATSGSGNITLSVFAKKGTSNTLVIYHDNVTIPGFFWAQFNIQTGVVLATNGAVVSTSIEDYGNGWFRCSVTGPDTNATGNIHNFTTYAGTSYLFGVQLEQGNYPTSYIPTQGASVTRNADVISKTGISSLIGQTEGTLFVDVNLDETTDYNGWFLKENATFDTFVFLQRETSGRIAAGYYGSGALQARIETAPNQPIGHYKIAFGYKNNDFVMYINGTQIGTDTSGSVSGLMDYIDLHWTQTGTNHQNAAALWKTRLTNTQLAQLTTI